MPRRFQHVAALATAFLLVACSPAPPPGKGRNLLLITLDTTRADNISHLGGDPRNTPNLDALAARSAVFTNARVEINNTNPSHITIFSGVRPFQHGVLSNHLHVPDDLDTLPLAFKRAGYATAGFAAVRHLALQIGWKGFDELPPVPHTLTATEVTDRAIGWIAARDEQPFFLWVHYWDPHWKYEPPAEIAALYGAKSDGSVAKSSDWEIRMYAAEIHYTDREVGRLLSSLELHGLQDDTLLVVTGDHGESLVEHGIYYDHLGLYEPQLRVPLLFHVPGLPPVRSNATVTSLDIVPTLVDLMGIELRNTSMNGFSLLPVLRGGTSEALGADRVTVHQHAHNLAVAVRQGRWKLILAIGKDDFFLALDSRVVS